MIKLTYDNTEQRGDLGRADGLNLETDEGLETAVSISLFTDARASAEDGLPPGADKRGWWGTPFLMEDAKKPLGSKLWLLGSRKASNETLTIAVTWAKDALKWMVEDGAASSVEANASRLRADVMLLTIEIQRPGKTAPRWRHAWEVQLGL